MAKTTSVTALPRLRFPDFRHAPRWRRVRGDALFDAINDRTATNGLPLLAITQEHGAIPRDQIDYHVSVSAKSIESYKLVRRGDFIISLRSFQGGIEYSEHIGICSPAYVILRRKGDGSDGYFRHLFKSERLIQQLTRNIEGLRDGKMISYRQFSDQLISTPEPLEQQKIADCLTSLDHVIAAQARKVEALKAHKRGLMQQLFPRQGEAIPRLRFPEFRDAPEWAEATIGSRSHTFSGGTPTSTNPAYYGGSIPFIRSAEIAASTTALSLTDAGLKDSAARLVERGDVLVALYGANSGDVALSRIAGAINQAILCVRPDGCKDFLYHLLTARKSRTIATYLQGGQGNLSGEIIKSLRVSFPLLDEQVVIARCLSEIDAVIDAHEASLGHLKSHKAGLMQQLFPSPDVD